MSKSHNYEVMKSLPPEAEDPVEFFEWGLPYVRFDASCFSMTWEIDFQTGHLSDFEQFKVDSHSAHFLLTLGKSKLTILVYFSDFGHITVILLRLGKMLGCKKQSKHPPFDKKFRNHIQGPAQVVFNDSISQNEELSCPVNK